MAYTHSEKIKGNVCTSPLVHRPPALGPPVMPLLIFIPQEDSRIIFHFLGGTLKIIDVVTGARLSLIHI